MAPQGTGAVVQAVAAGSEADREHIAPGEVIQMVQNEIVGSPSDLQTHIDRLRAKGGGNGERAGRRADGRRWVAIRLK